MDILYILIPISLVLVTVIVALVVWAVSSEQFSDLESPAHRILMDDDSVGSDKQSADSNNGHQA